MSNLASPVQNGHPTAAVGEPVVRVNVRQLQQLAGWMAGAIHTHERCGITHPRHGFRCERTLGHGGPHVVRTRLLAANDEPELVSWR